MNKRMLSNMAGTFVRLRPKVKMVEAGEVIGEADDRWNVIEVSDRDITLHNDRTDHRYTLGLDNVRSFQSPDFLLLRCDLSNEGNDIAVEPHIQNRVPKPTPEEVLERAVRNAVPSIPGAWSWPVEVFEDRAKLRAWFVGATRTEHGGVLLPSPVNPVPHVQIHIPKSYLVAAHKALIEEAQAEVDDPLAD
jgi:hypothetical protein